MQKVLVILGLTFGLCLLAFALQFVLPFRSWGPWSAIRNTLAFLSSVFCAAWLLFSCLAIPRSLLFLWNARRQGLPWKARAAGIAALGVSALPLLAILAVAVALGAGCARFPSAMAHSRFAWPAPALTPRQQELKQALERDVRALADTVGPRNALTAYSRLCAAADAIEKNLQAAGYTVRRQSYLPDTREPRPCDNLEAQILGVRKPNEIVVIGAHYDTVSDSPGANDNTSGTAAVLALARAFAGRQPGRTLRFVAFVNEEPPFFQGRDMGSLRYARACHEKGEAIVAMLSLETIGYYSDVPGSQRYPFKVFGRFFPTTGNFIGFVANGRSRSLLKSVAASFAGAVAFPYETAAMPERLVGVGWSDHWSFWQEGYPALMVTDTAPFRYPHYHSWEDTPDKLDFTRMAIVVNGLEQVVADLAECR